MPASIDITTAPQRDMDAVRPLVKINSELVDWVTVTAIEDSTGILPSRALLRLGSNQYDDEAPVTLNRFDYGFKRGARIEIFHEDEILFLGNLLKRRDTDDGDGSTVVWEAVDDRWLLSKIPLRGCLVYDPTDNVVKFIPRYVPRTNPRGKWNCIVVNVGSGIGHYPVFTWTSDVGKSYESPVEAFDPLAAVGEATAWTPRRFLQYLQLYATLDPARLSGTGGKSWRSLHNSRRLVWDTDSLQISGQDSQTQFDPLDRKMPDVAFRGEKVLGAIDKTLKAAGTHGLRIQYTALSPTSWRSRVQFYPKGYTGLRDDEVRRKVIPLQRSGSPVDINTAFAFNMHEDADEIAEAVLVEGAPVQVETSITFTNPTASDYAATSDGLKPAWTRAQETAFLQGINGGAGPGPGTYAKYPSVQGSTTLDLTADGGGSPARALAFARTEAAQALLRQCYPTVFRAFYADSAQITALFGLDAQYLGVDEYPLLLTARQIYDEQLQFALERVSGLFSGDSRIQKNFPVRIEVWGAADSAYHDVAFTKGLQQDGNSLIWLDGLADPVSGEPDSIIDGDLITDPLNVVLKKIRMNVAMPMDHRVLGYAEVDNSVSELDPGLATDLGGPPLDYIDSPDAYHEKHQFDSSPAAFAKFYAGENVVTTPLNRLLPPGSEQPHAEYAARRRLDVSRFPKRQSSWQMIGIRPEFRAGDWIDKVKMVNAVDSESDFDINAPIETVTYDFIDQRTVLGGLISQLPSQGGAVRVSNNPAQGVPVVPPSEDPTDAPGQLPPTRELSQFRDAGMAGTVGEAMGL